MITAHHYLAVAALLFGIGLAGALTRRNSILVLMSIELMLNAANLNLVAFGRQAGWGQGSEAALWVMCAIAIAAAESGVGLALILAIYRHRRSTHLDESPPLKG